ncbi:MAG TPA: NAD(P)/FAD-dependent oxidoreductase [Acidimicrobiales bacterium]|nr:NAD(P)/FAD-dependent oxidoreductase [Acidimicrobiales bacterium]
MQDYDVIVVGGGIAGASAGLALAQRGASVLVLERSLVHEDRVRGEGMSPWGVTDAARLGADEVMLQAGGTFATEVATYDEAWDPASVDPLDLTVFGLRGFLHVGHPDACEALCSAAVAAGVILHRGVEVTEIATGTRPTVTYVDGDGAVRQATGRLVIGADGRTSFVRRHLGFELRESEALTFGGGMLVTDHRWPAERLAVGTEGPFHFIITPREGAARLYLFALPDVGRPLFSGAEKAEAFLAAFELASIPDRAAFADVRPAGPCAGFPMTDAWVDDPVAPGVVLVGDAAGWSNPIIGQGLAVAMRDVRQVVEAFVDGSPDERSTFVPYAEERRERMRRLRATAFVDTCVLSRFDDVGRAERIEWRDRINADPDAAAHVLGKAIGVDDFPASAYEPATIERLIGGDHPYRFALESHAI